MQARDSDRHWSTVSLGIVTISTAAMGGAFFAVDLGQIVTSVPTYLLMMLALVIYFLVLAQGGRAMFTTSAELNLRGTSRREATRLLYTWFVIDLFAIAGLLIAQANANLLKSLPISS